MEHDENGNVGKKRDLSSKVGQAAKKFIKSKELTRKGNRAPIGNMEHDVNGNVGKKRDLSSKVGQAAKKFIKSKELTRKGKTSSKEVHQVKGVSKEGQQGSNRVAVYSPYVKLVRTKDVTKCTNDVQQTHNNNESQHNKNEKEKKTSSTQYSLYDDPIPGCSWMGPYQYQNINEARTTSFSDEYCLSWMGPYQYQNINEARTTSFSDEYLKMAIPESLKDMDDREWSDLNSD
ncbi:unnamed protein product [Leptosia nina]|uniref:Uncharacterized protein n=1 Tax=Leptosia nina TaxID=320188 RepID=A0AAV1J9J5_9NEOP